MFHPFYVKNDDGTGEWKAASNLKAGDELLSEDGNKVKVSEVKVEKLAEEITVYNLELDEVHTYFVAGGVLVHNKCDIDNEKVKQESESHIFSNKHKKGGIMELGDTEGDIMESGLDVIKVIDDKMDLPDGPLQIRTKINGIKCEIRIFIKNGSLINFDMFKGWSNEIKKSTITWLE